MSMLFPLSSPFTFSHLHQWTLDFYARWSCIEDAVCVLLAWVRFETEPE